MPVYKRKLAKGRVSWMYLFELPGAARKQFKQAGFATKGEAEAAEAARRLKETSDAQREAGEVPKTLAEVLKEWLTDTRANLSPKTAVRYEEMIAYLSPSLTGLPITEIMPLHLHREWKRLHESGGRHRKSKEPRSLSPKTVRNIAGVVSSAYGWAILYGIVTVNPVTHSKPPQGKARKGIALTSMQQGRIIGFAGGQWGVLLEVCAALGARRGEVLALRWSDIRDGHAHISRSLGQAKDKVFFKDTKTGNERRVEVPARTLTILESHRATQCAARNQFGEDYRKDLDLIFATSEGEPLRPDSVSSKISLMCRESDLPKGASLHTLRHTHASMLIGGGEAITDVSERLGHSNVKTTLGIYSHAIPGRSKLAKQWEDLQESKKQ